MQAKENFLTSIKEKARELYDSAGKLSRKQVGIIIALLVALLISAGVNYYKSRPVEIKIRDAHGKISETDTRKVIVHVAGSVNNPGLYELKAGSRIADAIEKAGGPKPDASLDSINLAARLEDGNQIVVPTVNIPGPVAEGGGNAGNNGTGGQININTADAGELDKLPGIGPSYAERIIEYRKKNGPFSSPDELDEIKGIGPKMIEEIRGLVTI